MSTFTPPSDPLLTMAAEEIPIEDITSPEIQEIIDRMYEVAKGNRGTAEKTKRTMVGLAAPQIGILKSIILVDTGVDAERKNLGFLSAFINPKIVWASAEQLAGREGCYSVDSRLWGIVCRANAIKLEAFDRSGQPIAQEFSGFTARIFQHEIDHLHGIRFPDRITDPHALHWVEPDQFPDYREHWATWPHVCPRDTWIAMKKGM